MNQSSKLTNPPIKSIDAAENKANNYDEKTLNFITLALNSLLVNWCDPADQ